MTENAVVQGERKQQQFLEGHASSFGYVLLDDMEEQLESCRGEFHVMDVTKLRGERLSPMYA